MSTQGTGSISRYSFERSLLDCWGQWAKNGGADTGISRVDLLKKGGVGLLFGETWMMTTDSTIAGLPDDHKKTLKKVYLSGRGLTIRYERREAAVAAFALALNSAVDTPLWLA